MRSLRLSSKIVLAVIRLEESSDRAVAIERDECSGRSVEAGDGAIASRNFQYVTAGGSVAELLRGKKVLALRDVSELGTVFRKVLVELATGTETDLRSHLGCGSLALSRRSPRLRSLHVAAAGARGDNRHSERCSRQKGQHRCDLARPD